MVCGGPQALVWQPPLRCPHYRGGARRDIDRTGQSPPGRDIHRRGRHCHPLLTQPSHAGMRNAMRPVTRYLTIAALALCLGVPATAFARDAPSVLVQDEFFDPAQAEILAGDT